MLFFRWLKGPFFNFIPTFGRVITKKKNKNEGEEEKLEEKGGE